MSKKVLTLEEVEERLDQFTNQPEKYIRNDKGNLVEANTSIVKAVGTNAFLTEESNVDIKYRPTQLLSSVSKSTYKLADVSDKLRAAQGSFWAEANPQKPRSPDTNNLIFLAKENQSAKTFNIFHHDEIDLGDPEDVQEIFGAKRHWFLIQPKKEKFRTKNGNYSGQKFKKFLLGGKHEGKTYRPIINEGVWHHDHSLSMSSPFDRNDIERLNSGLKSMYAEIEPRYNFYIKSYEMIMSSSLSDELSFPNMYVFFAQKSAKEKFQEDRNKNPQTATPPNPFYEEHITLGDSIKESTSKAMSMPFDERKDFRLNDPAGQYYDMWSVAYPRAKKRGLLDRAIDKFKNVYFPLGDMGLLTDANRQQYLFPMYTSIEFSTDPTTQFGEILRQTQLSSLLISDVFKNNAMSGKRMFQSVKTSVMAKSDDDNYSGASLNITKTHYSVADRRVFDLEDWMETFASKSKASDEDGLDENNSIFIGAYANEKKVSEDPQYKFWKSLMSVILKGKLKKIVEHHTRSFKDVMSGKLSHHETACYRVAKFKGRPSGEPIQNFYFPNSNEIDVLKFVDTQVKYGQRYTYVVYAYELVVGTKYRYESVVATGEGAVVQVTVAPSLKMVETPYFSKNVLMIDSPPVHPDVEMVPYRAVNDRVRIQLNGNVGKYELKPEKINEGDFAEEKKHLMAQSKILGEKIEYQGDDPPKAFQIWRMTKKPRKYSDFDGHLIKTVRTGDGYFHASSATFVDKIEPNTKYYYTFRSVDVHGNISYPTPIYEYEMIDDSGSVYPVMQVVPISLTEQRQKSKAGKRFIRIYPSFGNTLPELSELDGVATAGDVRAVPLGIQEEKTWGKKFKIRIKSKNTGKQVDFNVSFEHKHVKDIKSVKGGR